MSRMAYPWRSILVSAMLIGAGTLILSAPPLPKTSAIKPAEPPVAAPSTGVLASTPPKWTTEAERVDPQTDTLPRIADARPVNTYRDVLEIPRGAKMPDSVTITIAGKVVRFGGLKPVPPEAICRRRGGGSWNCGMGSRAALRSLVAGKALLCRPLPASADTPDAVDCTLGNERLAKKLVEQGWAVPATAGDADLDTALATARDKKSGVWSSPGLEALAPDDAIALLAAGRPKAT